MLNWRKDSVKEMRKRKTNEELTRENAELRKQVGELEGQLTSTQLALCDVYEALVGGVE